MILNEAVVEPVAVDALGLGLSLAPFNVALKPILTVIFIGEEVVTAPVLSVAFTVIIGFRAVALALVKV